MQLVPTTWPRSLIATAVLQLPAIVPTSTSSYSTVNSSMPTPLRDALELAYHRRRDYRQTAADLGVTEDEARRRLRLGLQLLSTANTHTQDGSSPVRQGRPQ